MGFIRSVRTGLRRSEKVLQVDEKHTSALIINSWCWVREVFYFNVISIIIYEV